MVFDTMRIRNVFSWNIMLAAYVQDQNFEQANYLFSNMPEKDVVSWNAMLAMYGQCGRLQDAFAMFKVMPVRNVISWNSMITACVQYGDGEEALQIFSEMKRNGLKPNKVTFITSLSACTTINALVQGRFVHAQILETGFLPDNVLGNALVNMYGKCGSLEDANALFDRMARRSVQWWNAIIAVYSQYRRSRDAVKLYLQMQREGVKQDKATFLIVLSACSTLTALAEGRLIHASIVESGQYLVLDVRNALVNMYSKCGSLEDAFATFNKISHKDLISWNTIIAAFAQHGQVQETIHLFEQLESTHALPNDLSILAILSACSKVFLTDEGCHFFICLTQRHNITPTVNHYNCIVDLLGRAGWLNEAMDLLKSMPGQPIASSWLALLSASKVHADVKHADYAAKECFRLDPESSAPYAILSNIYATARLIEA